MVHGQDSGDLATRDDQINRDSRMAKMVAEKLKKMSVDSASSASHRRQFLTDLVKVMGGPVAGYNVTEVRLLLQ